MEKLVRVIAETICDKPEAVKVQELKASASSIIEVKVDQSDLGKMIGKHGKTAQSIRNIIYAASFKFNKRYTLEILAND